MRIFFLYIIGLVTVSSCSYVSSIEDCVSDRPMQGTAVHGTYVPIEEARSVLEDFLASGLPMTRGNVQRVIENSFSIGGLKTKSGEGELPVIHIFNFKDSSGYAIMSGDRRIDPILCVTEKGTLSQDSEVDNPGLALALTELEDYCEMRLSMAEENDTSSVGYEHTFEYDPWENYSTVGSVMNCHWDQYPPFNAACPIIDTVHAVVGCTATAVGQIMYDWGRSTMYRGISFDWTKMHQILYWRSQPSDSSCWTLVQQLLCSLGSTENLDATYGTGSTHVSDLSNVTRTFEHFGYYSGGSYESYDFPTLMAALSDGPALGHGADTMVVTRALGVVLNTTYKSHDWVFDQVLTRRRRGYMYEDGNCVDSFYEYQNLVHINWGWGGRDDGYFANTRFNADEGPVTRTIGTFTYGSDRYYRYNLQMNCSIEPDSPSL